VLAGVSGGADSMALLALLVQVQKVLGFRLQVVHYFHGDEAQNPEQSQFRTKARSLVYEFSQNKEVEFFTNQKRPEGLRTEAEFRSARYSFFASHAVKQVKALSVVPVLALGHHREDALETQLIHLIRGSGAASFRRFGLDHNPSGNEDFAHPILRPLIEESKRDLVSFLAAEKIPYLEDPSHQDVNPLRNWLRSEWLPALENKRPGSLKAMSRSLSLLAEALSDTSQQDLFSAIEPGRISRTKFRQLNPSSQSHLLFTYLRTCGVRGLQKSHIEEVRKRLDSEQKSLKFNVGGCSWQTDKDWIKVSGLLVPYEG